MNFKECFEAYAELDNTLLKRCENIVRYTRRVLRFDESSGSVGFDIDREIYENIVGKFGDMVDYIDVSLKSLESVADSDTMNVFIERYANGEDIIDRYDNMPLRNTSRGYLMNLDLQGGDDNKIASYSIGCAVRFSGIDECIKLLDISRNASLDSKDGRELMEGIVSAIFIGCYGVYEDRENEDYDYEPIIDGIMESSQYAGFLEKFNLPIGWFPPMNVFFKVKMDLMEFGNIVMDIVFKINTCECCVVELDPVNNKKIFGSLSIISKTKSNFDNIREGFKKNIMNGLVCADYVSKYVNNQAGEFSGIDSDKFSKYAYKVAKCVSSEYFGKAYSFMKSLNAIYNSRYK